MQSVYSLYEFHDVLISHYHRIIITSLYYLSIFSVYPPLLGSLAIHLVPFSPQFPLFCFYLGDTSYFSSHPSLTKPFLSLISYIKCSLHHQRPCFRVYNASRAWRHLYWVIWSSPGLLVSNGSSCSAGSSCYYFTERSLAFSYTAWTVHFFFICFLPLSLNYFSA